MLPEVSVSLVLLGVKIPCNYNGMTCSELIQKLRKRIRLPLMGLQRDFARGLWRTRAS